MMKLAVILLGCALYVAPAQAQNQSVVATGALTPGHALVLQQTGTPGSAVTRDAGPALAGNFTEIGITNDGLPLCVRDKANQHLLCLGANALGGGLISYNPIGLGAPLGLFINLNGTSFPFPGAGNGNVVGPTSPAPTATHIAVWNGGTTLIDAGLATITTTAGLTTLGITDGSTAQPNVSQMLEITHAGPGSSSYLGNKDYVRVSIGNFPTTSEFAGDPVGTVGSLQGIVGAVVQPSNAAIQPAAFFGVAGYSACQAPVGNGPGGSCTGVSGNGVALASASAATTALAAGVNGVATNAPNVSNPATRTGFDYINLTGAEIDTNLMKLSDGSAPHANVVGISIIGVSETAPATGPTDCNGGPCLSEAIFINPVGLNAVIPWHDGIFFTDGSTTNALNIGAICQGTGQCSSQAIELNAYTAPGPANRIAANITLGGGGGGFLVVNAPGQIGLQVGGANVLNVTAASIDVSQPLIGGQAANSQIVLHSTTNGAPSGDQIVSQSSLFTISSANGLTEFASFSSSLIDLVVPLRFHASTTGAVAPAFTNAPTGCTNVVWLGPYQTASPAQSNVYLAACHS